MKKSILLALAIISIFGAGCKTTAEITKFYGLSEEQQKEALRKYPYPEGTLNILPEDNVAVATIKIIGRTLIAIPSMGLLELGLAIERDRPYLKYAIDLENERLKKYYNSFINKEKYIIIKEFGPPARTFTDGQGGEIYIYEKVLMTGGQSYANYNEYGGSYTHTPIRYHKDVLEFYFNSENKCYTWKTSFIKNTAP